MSLTRAKIQNLDTTVEWIVDPLVVFNQAATQANVDVGLIFNRDNGASSRVALYWNETSQKITTAYTSSNGLTNSNIAIVSYANIQVNSLFGNLSGGTGGDTYITGNLLPTGNLIYNLGSPTARFKTGYFSAGTIDLGGSTISVDPTNGFQFIVGGTGTPIYLASNGAISGTTLSSSGTLNVGTSAIIGTTLNVGTNITAGGYVNVTGNILSTGAIHNSLTVNGNQTVTGYINTTGNVLAAVFNGGQVNTSGLINTAGNLLATSGVFNALTVNGNESVTGYLNVTGNVLTAQLNAGQINTTGNVLATAGVFSGLTVNGIINASGNILSTGATHNTLTVNGNATIGIISVPGVVHTLIGNINQSGAGTLFYNTPGNLMAAIGRFGSISSDGFINTSANISASQGIFATINTTGLINSSANISASMFSGGQIYVSGLVNAGGNVLAQAATFNGMTVNGNIAIGSVLTPGAGHTIVGNVTQSGAGTVFFNTPGNVMASVGRFGSISSDGFINTSANISASLGNFGAINTSGNILSAGAILNSLTVNGNQNINSGYLNVQGNILGQTGTFGTLVVNGTTTVNNLNSTGNVLAQAGVFNGLTVNGATTQAGTLTISSGFINSSGNILATAGTFNALTVNGNESITGYLNVAGNIIATTANVLYANVSSNLTVGGSGFFAGQYTENSNIAGVFLGNSGTTATPSIGFFNGTQAQNWQIDNFNNTFRWRVGGASQMTLTSSGLLSTTALNLSANILAQAATFNALTVNGNEIVTGYINSTGNVLASSHTGGTVFVTGYINTAANVLAAGGIFNSLQVNGNETVIGYLNVTGNVLTAQLNAGQINTTGNIIAQSATFNSSQINGNESITGYLNVAGNILGSAGTLNSLTVNGTTTLAGTVTVSSGFLNVAGNVVASTVNATTLNATGNVLANTVAAWGLTGIVQTAAQPTITSVGNLTSLSVAGTTNIYAVTHVNDPTNAIPYQLGSGAFYVAGGMSIGKDVWVGGNLYAANLISETTTILQVNDPLLYLSSNTVYPYNYDIGFYSHFIGGPANVYAHTGLVRNDADGAWYLFSNVGEPSSGQVTFDGNTIYDTLIAGTIKPGVNLVSSLGNTISYYGNAYINNIYSLSTWGTLQTAAQPNITSVGILTSLDVSGNILAAGGVYNSLAVNGNQSVSGYLNVVGNILSTGATYNALTVNGYINNNGNISTAQLNAGQINTTGNVLASGAVFTVTGVNGVLYANGTQDTSSTTTGAIVVPTGGISVAGNAYVGKSLYVGGTAAFNENLTNPMFVATRNGSAYAQAAIFNTNPAASSDWLAYPSDYPGQSNDHGWVDLGFTGTSFNDSNYSITRAQDGYVFASGANASVGGNLVLATDYTGSYNDIVFGVGSFLNTSEVARFHGNIGTAGNLWIKYTTQASSVNSLTGALRVDGGIGVFGNITAGSLTTGGSQHTFFGNVQVNGIGFAQMPAGTQLQRPGAPVAGMIRFNLDTNQFEGYSNVWAGLGGGGGGGSAPGGVTTTIQYNAGSSALGGIATMNYIVANGAIIISTGTNSTSTTTGALQVIGGIGVTANVTADIVHASNNGNGTNFQVGDDAWIGDINIANTFGIKGQQDGTQGYVRFGSVNTNSLGVNGSGPLSWGGVLNIGGNLLAAAGTFSGLTVNGNQTISGYVNAAGNVLASVFNGGQVNTSGLINTAGNVLASQVSAGSVVTTGVGNFGGNVLATGGIFNALTVNGNVQLGLVSVPGAGHSIIGNVTQSGAGTIFYNTPGNILAAQGSFGTVNATGLINTAGNVIAAVITASQFNTAGNVLAAGGVYNALQVNGATTLAGTVTVSSGFVNSSGNILATAGTFNALTVNGTVTATTFSGAGTSLTGTASSLSIGGSAASATTVAVTTTSAAGNYYLTLNTTSGTAQTQYNNGSIYAVPSTGALVATSFSGAGTGLTGTASSLSIGGAAPAGSLSGSTLASGVTASSLTSVGTLTGLTVSGTTVLSSSSGYLSVGTSSQLNSFKYSQSGGSLGGTAGNQVLHATYNNATSNADYLEITNTRTATGTSWTTAGMRLQQKVDSTWMGWMQFNTDLANGGIVWGTGTSTVGPTSIAARTILDSSGNFYPAVNNTQNLGASGQAWATVYGTTFSGVSTTAKYADLAENYTSDKKYVPGTVVVFGGDKEVTISTESHDPAIAGIVSTDPAYLMNSEGEGVAVALQGRVPCRVQGPVKKGDRLVSSSMPGVATVMDKTLYEPGCIIGKALEDITDDRVHTIEVVVGRV